MYEDEIQKCLQYARGKTVSVASINRCIIDKDLCDELYNKEKNRFFFCFMLLINDQCHLLHVCLFMLIYVALFSPKYTSRAFVRLIHSGPANQPWRYFCIFPNFLHNLPHVQKSCYDAYVKPLQEQKHYLLK